MDTAIDPEQAEELEGTKAKLAYHITYMYLIIPCLRFCE